MDTDLRDTERRADTPSHRAGADSNFAVRERLVLSALVAAVSLWIRVVEVMPNSRRRR
jgi:hypothetical protein